MKFFMIQILPYFLLYPNLVWLRRIKTNKRNREFIHAYKKLIICGLSYKKEPDFFFFRNVFCSLFRIKFFSLSWKKRMHQLQRLIKFPETAATNIHSFLSSPTRAHLVTSRSSSGGGNENVNLIRNFFSFSDKNNISKSF